MDRATDEPVPARWHFVLRRDELPKDGGGVTVEIEGRYVALFDHGGRVFAIGDTCPHSGASLGLGVVRDGDVTCPWHAFHFELATGRNTDGLGLCVPTHPVRAGEDGAVEIQLPPRRG